MTANNDIDDDSATTHSDSHNHRTGVTVRICGLEKLSVQKHLEQNGCAGILHGALRNSTRHALEKVARETSVAMFSLPTRNFSAVVILRFPKDLRLNLGVVSRTMSGGAFFTS